MNTLCISRSVQRWMLIAALALPSLFQVEASDVKQEGLSKLQKPRKSEMQEQKKEEEPKTLWDSRVRLEKNSYEDRVSDILSERLSFHATNYFTLQNLVGKIEESIEQRVPESDVFGKPVWGRVRHSVQEAVRESVVRNMRLDDLWDHLPDRLHWTIDNVIPEDFMDTVRRMFAGKPELGVLNNPFDPYGVPGQEWHEPGRLPHRLAVEPRLLSMNPSVHATYHTNTKSVAFGVHAYRKGADALVEVPLTPAHIVTGGIRFDDYAWEERAYGFVGLTVFSNHRGYFTVGTRIPIRDTEKNRPWTLMSYSLWY